MNIFVARSNVISGVSAWGARQRYELDPSGKVVLRAKGIQIWIITHTTRVEKRVLRIALSCKGVGKQYAQQLLAGF